MHACIFRAMHIAIQEQQIEISVRRPRIEIFCLIQMFCVTISLKLPYTYFAYTYTKTLQGGVLNRRILLILSYLKVLLDGHVAKLNR